MQLLFHVLNFQEFANNEHRILNEKKPKLLAFLSLVLDDVVIIRIFFCY